MKVIENKKHHISFVKVFALAYAVLWTISIFHAKAQITPPFYPVIALPYFTAAFMWAITPIPIYEVSKSFKYIHDH
ncbi:hypothetical protein NDJ00_23910 [Vibrio parahaemolyticus]|uniref:hypothetical protein n=1 Tax=Vibrio parahaemolyticus TaxID=670 RepID=UPI00215E3877|nr:hypothetical protein [Vibrio parahaemolyticus]MCS0117228.1 hypothetical protein [Vibrio parahaemolyticus]